MTEKQKLVLETIKQLTRDCGRVLFGIDLISNKTGIPKSELYNHDNFTGIFIELSDYGYICVRRAESPDVSLDSECFC